MRTLVPLALIAVSVASCAEPWPRPGTPPAPQDPAPSGPTPSSAPPGPTPPGTAATAAPACRLPAPKKGPDACATDADCGPIEPCHARECVAKARAKPRTPDTVCTEIFSCDSTDANHCGCFEGRCSLVPGKP